MGSLLNSNRQDDVKPKKTASLADIENKDKKTKTTAPAAKHKKKELQTEKAGHKTTLSIDSNVKNKLQAMVLLGDAINQKEGFAVAIQSYYENLPEDKKNMFDMFVKSLNRNQ